MIAKGLFLIACAVVAVTSGASSARAAATGQDHRGCTGVDMNLSQARKLEYADLVSDALGKKAKPSEVAILVFLASGPWSMTYADTPVADPGYFFFQTVAGGKQFKDVWGGMAQPSDRPELIAWAKKLGAPNNLAACFAQLVIAG